mgnify:CR=1 FL=1
MKKENKRNFVEDDITARNDLVKQDAEALIQMYQSGFLDGFMIYGVRGSGFRSKKGINKYWERIKNECRKSFEKRFVNKMQENLTKLKKEAK